MEQIEKVCKGLECFVNHVNAYRDDCRKAECEYLKAGDCEMMVMSDALALIRQQQERIKELEAGNIARLINEKDFEKADGWGNIPAWFENNPSLKVKTIDGWGLIRYVCLHVKETRFWTQRPTDEQREAEAWD